MLSSVYPFYRIQVFEGILEPYAKTVPSLYDMWSRGTQVIVLGYEKNATNSVEGVSNLWPRSSISQPWADTRTPKILENFLKDQYK